MIRKFLGAALAAAILVLPVQAAEKVKVGVLKFGTVNWELNALKANKLDEKYGVDVEIVGFAGEDATAVALRAGEVDMIVSDWIDVSRARASGDDLTMVPYSSSVGAIMVAGDSPIKAVSDLKGRKIGVAGGPLDKSWILIQTMAKKDFGLDIAKENEIVYGAPPLLAEKAKQGELDAVLNFWHWSARLEAEGFRKLVSAEDAANALGASGAVSALGYVFSEGWAKAHPEAAMGFVKASRETKALLKESDAEWDRMHTEGVIKDEGKVLATLRDRYRDGIPARRAADEEADAAKLFGILAEAADGKLTGGEKTMRPGTYWTELKNAF